MILGKFLYLFLNYPRTADFFLHRCHFAMHDKTMLIGADSSHITDRCMRVTIHHCFFDGTRQRHPRVRFGRVHLYNNYTRNWGIYAVCASVEAQVYLNPSSLFIFSFQLNFGKQLFCRFSLSAIYMNQERKRLFLNTCLKRYLSLTIIIDAVFKLTQVIELSYGVHHNYFCLPLCCFLFFF